MHPVWSVSILLGLLNARCKSQILMPASDDGFSQDSSDTGGPLPIRAEPSGPSVSSNLTASWSSTRTTTEQPVVVQTYTVVLKDGTNQSGVQQFCSSAHAKLGMACRSTLQHTVDSVIMQATEDQVIKLKDAFGNVTSSVLDDERLQLPIAPVLLSKDLSAAHLGVDLSAGLWGLDRLDGRSPMRDFKYTSDADGTGVHIYVIDTGINASHEDFQAADGSGSRVRQGFSVKGLPPPDMDCHGHGTHVAGTAAGLTYGVAKNAWIHPLTVFSCEGIGTWEGVVTALEWVQSNVDMPAVVSMSLGGATFPKVDAAAQRLTDIGVTVVVAGGNPAADACNYSPAREPSVITVGAIKLGDGMARFSNGGNCINIMAPGVNIISAAHGSTTATAVMSGTSMATPHVAGAAALLLQANPAAQPWEVMLTLQLQSSWDWIPNHTLMPGTPNCILNIVVPLQVVTINTVLIDDDSIILIPANSNSRVGYRL